VKSKCLNRAEFLVVGWTDPEGSRSHIGALLLGYYTDDGRLLYAGRAGTGMTDKELKRLAGVLAPLSVAKMPLAEPPPRDSRFGSPLKLSRVHWCGRLSSLRRHISLGPKTTCFGRSRTRLSERISRRGRS
jgi:ATP-dependent DNA ligase